MAVELSWLVASVILYGVMIIVQAVFSNIEHTPADLAGPRDAVTDRSVFVGRAKRANSNMIEALLLFAPLVLVAVLAERTNDMTALGAAVFFWARLAYAPAYWLGVPWLRTLIWLAGFIATLIVLFQVLPFTGTPT